jgi:hypothetical protein
LFGVKFIKRIKNGFILGHMIRCSIINKKSEEEVEVALKEKPKSESACP